MKRVAEPTGECGSQSSYSSSLATPRSSTTSGVYGLSVDVFVFHLFPHFKLSDLPKVVRVMTIVCFLLMTGTVAFPVEVQLDDARNIVSAMGDRLDNIAQYRCKLHTISISGQRQEDQTFDYAFKRPRSIRMYVLNGKNRGSVLIYKNGVIHGHRGGLLSWIVLTFKPSDPDVVTIRGGQVDQSDFCFILDVLHSAVKEEKIRLSGVESLNGKDHYRLALFQHVDPLENGAATGTFWIDSGSLVVSQYELYDKDGQLIYRQIHDQLELNAPLPDGQFKL